MTEPHSLEIASEYQLWSAPNEELSLYIRADVLRALHAEMQRGVKLLPKRGAEVGGLLLGTVINPHMLVVRSVEPMACEYRTGPTWTLSAQDKAGLNAALLSVPQTAPGVTVLGVYRSNTRPGQEMSAEDLEVYQSHFPAAHAVFVILQHVNGGPGYATVAYRDNGVVRRIAERFEINPLARAAKPLPVVEEFRTVDTPRPAAVPLLSRYRKYLLPLAVVAGAAVIGAIGMFSLEAWRSQSAYRNTSPFGLQVSKKADHLVLSWDAGAPFLRGARRAHLTVRDGGYQREVELSPNQLRSGRLFYLAGGDDIELRLEVDEEDGRRLGESVSFLSSQNARAPHPEVDILEPPRRKQARAEALREAPAIVVPTVTVKGPPGPAPTAATASTAPAAPITAAVVPAGRRSFVPPPDASPTTAASLTPSAPVEDLPPDVLVLSSARPPMNLPPPQSITPATAPPSVVRSAGSAPALIPPPAAKSAAAAASESYASPEPIRQVTPVVPPNVRAMLHGPVEVQVRVSIDRTGKVTGASVASMKGALAGFLTDSALQAAWRFQFSPAKANGHALPSEKVIVFNFSGK